MPLILTNLHGFNARRRNTDVVLTNLGGSQSAGAKSNSWTSDSFAVTPGLPVIVAIATDGANFINATSVYIGGVLATEFADEDTADRYVALYGASVTGLSSISVTANFNRSVNGPHFRCFSLANLQTLSPHDTIVSTDTTPTGTIDCPAGGVIIGAGVSGSGSHTWTGITEIDDGDPGTFAYSTAADMFSTEQVGLTVEVSASGSNSMVVVSLR